MVSDGEACSSMMKGWAANLVLIIWEISIHITIKVGGYLTQHVRDIQWLEDTESSHALFLAHAEEMRHTPFLGKAMPGSPCQV